MLYKYNDLMHMSKCILLPFCWGEKKGKGIQDIIAYGEVTLNEGWHSHFQRLHVQGPCKIFVWWMVTFIWKDYFCIAGICLIVVLPPRRQVVTHILILATNQALQQHLAGGAVKDGLWVVPLNALEWLTQNAFFIIFQIRCYGLYPMHLIMYVFDDFMTGGLVVVDIFLLTLQAASL